jgi:hypothetical protein
MYLFEDGLVRMCTEEYVKPTKQVQIHLSICYYALFCANIIISMYFFAIEYECIIYAFNKLCSK